ncbi:phosphate ABC transporter permease PstA [Myxosarcina sp. GI1]|uniref:phosphate ABC transporter permease PstA n=1 Tax=Myxosarcina sp. GI1 TaxID=1541065 RepID=UPI000ABE2B38|nr:phosphate ABC transporter permease PstA [Myxosarcina sp. GI1]
MTSATNQHKDTSGLEKSSKPRTIIGTILNIVAFSFLGLSILPLGLVIIYVLIKGGGRLGLNLFTQLPPAALQEGGGIANAIVGTLILVGIAAVISIPIGVLAAVYLSEFSPARAARWIRFATNVLSGVPSIIVGIFAYGAIVLRTGGFSAFAGGFALAVLMLPIIVRTTDEALQIVPQEVRWASVGVGASNFHTVLKIVLPAALPAIVTGTTLAIARAAGETAPLIFTALFTQFWPNGLFEPIPSLSVLVYNYATVPYENQRELAWAASLILVLLILITSILSRLATRKSVY